MWEASLAPSRFARCLLIAVAAILLLSDPARAETPRRISVALEPKYYVFDSDYFDLGNAVGAGAAFRCEIGSDIYLENTIGAFLTKGSGVSVTGLDYRFNLLAIFPVLIPYRPIARLGVGFLSTNPVTVTPTATFRPGQTTFYIIGGAGITKSLFDAFLVEVGANYWITPYKYRIYRFNRVDVETQDQIFIHVEILLGISYAF